MQAEVREWFERRTSRGSDWDRGGLARAKGRTRVSVVLPAKDEESTVGAIVESLRAELVERVPLIDELVVVDSGSVDRTAAVAAAAGARVVPQRRVLPGLEDRPGKGEALWKALHVTDGDVIVYIDADLHDFDPQFVVGLLGPLLSDPGTAFVKAFYDRPLDTGQTMLPAGGGRVTEILARPLLNLHWPRLSGIVQPLAGEYAGRRSLLEAVPFVSGYGVEIALLVDVFERVGLDAMCQVDLGSRKHRNSSDAALGRMAAQVYLALQSRIERYGRGRVAVEPWPYLTQYTRAGDRFSCETTHVGITERPPMAQLHTDRNRGGQRLGQARRSA